MNSKPSSGSALALVLFLSTAGMAAAQQYSQPPRYAQPPPNYYNYQQPQEREGPLDFIPRLGQKVGQAVRRVFYGETTQGGYSQPPPSYGYSQPPARQYQPQAPAYPQQPPPAYPQQPPPAYTQPRYQTPPTSQPPQYNYPPMPPAPAAPRTLPPASASKPTTSKSTPGTTRTYTPPRVEEPAKKSSTVTPKPPVTTTKPKKTVSAPPPTPKPKEPEAVTSRRSEAKPKEEPPASFPSSSNSGSFLKGKKTSKPGRVISLYPPYKELDITGLESGSLALDPTTQKVFEVP